MTGTIPTEMGNTQIFNLEVYDNAFTGTIPSQLGLLSNLGTYRVMSFSITKPVVVLYSALRATADTPSLVHFDVSNNLLTGTLPSQLCFVGTRGGML
jgi:hypothetical protein